jgi:hypothetical protein
MNDIKITSRSRKQYFSYIVAVSIIGGGNQSTWRKQMINKLSHNVVTRTSRHEQDSKRFHR